MGLTILKASISLIAIAIALVHLVYPDLEIDMVTVALLVIALIPWLSPLIRSIEIPGVGKVNFPDLKETERKAEKAGLIKEEPVKNLDYSFLSIAEQNPSLALVGLRIEIEKRLRALAERYNISGEHRSMRYLIQCLHKHNSITREEYSALTDMGHTLNQAAHGVEHDARIVGWIMATAPKILESLDEKLEAKNA